jgi:hypothetical protein
MKCRSQALAAEKKEATESTSKLSDVQTGQQSSGKGFTNRHHGHTNIGENFLKKH